MGGVGGLGGGWGLGVAGVGCLGVCWTACDKLGGPGRRHLQGGGVGGWL